MFTPIKVFVANSDRVMTWANWGLLRSGDEGFPCLEADSTDEQEEALIGRTQLVQALIKCGCTLAGKLAEKA